MNHLSKLFVHYEEVSLAFLEVLTCDFNRDPQG